MFLFLIKRWKLGIRDLKKAKEYCLLSLRFLLLTLRVNVLDDICSCAWGQGKWIRKASEESFPFLLSIMALLFPLYNFQLLTKIWKRYQNAENIINASVAIAWLYISYFFGMLAPDLILLQIQMTFLFLQLPG